MKNTYILQLEAKDIYDGGFVVKKDNKKKYKATLDYSMESIHLDYFFPKKKIFYCFEDKQYSDGIISVKFKYSVKNDDGKVLIGTKILRDILYEKGFYITINGKKVHMIRFKRSSGSSRVGKCLFIREDLYNKMIEWSYMELNYKDGISIDLASIEAYISLTTSSIIDTIKINPRSILIIDDYKSIFNDKVMATEIIKVNGSDRLNTEPKEVKISNNIWDGQSLLDASVFGIAPNENIQWVDGKYKDKGFLLIRNRFFKSACFNTNIQLYMRKKFGDDYETAKVTDMFGNEMLAKDVLLITTPSSIKYLKYGEWKDYIRQLEPEFGVVKYDKPTHFFKGKYVQSHYQFINTIQFSKEDVKDFLQPSLDYIKLLKNDIRVFRNHLYIKQKENLEIGEINSTDDFMLNMLKLNDKFQYTDTFVDFRKDTIDSYVNNLKQGHVLISGNYSVLFGNCLEMLKASTGDFNGNSVINGDEVHCKNFKYNIELLGCRSPHVTMGNLWICKNVECKVIDIYFNLSKQIICVNSIDNNVLERLSSSDFDSDALLLTPCKQSIEAVRKNYDKFLVPTSLVEAKKVPRTNTWKEKSDLDINTSVNKIGEIINLSQILNSILWNKVNKGTEINSKDIQDLYADISQLDVMSCIEIDKAKKEFSVNNQKELDILREKYKIVSFTENKKVINKKKQELYIEMKALKEDGQDYKYFIEQYQLENVKETQVKPSFFKEITKKKQYDNVNVIYKSYHTNMDYLEDIIKRELKDIRADKRTSKNTTTFTQIFSKDITLKHARDEQIGKMINEAKELKKQTSAIWINENLEGSEKYIKANELKNNYIDKVKRYKINSDTIKKIIKILDEEQKISRENKNNPNEKTPCDNKVIGIGRKLLSILYKSHTEEFLKVFMEHKEIIETIRPIRKNEDTENKEIIKIYDMDYVVDKK